MSATERRWWRDMWLSDRHRSWGMNCPAVDIDFLAVEYDAGQARALIDYKCKFPKSEADNANFRALRGMADASCIPFFLAFYSPSKRYFAVQVMNTYAERFWCQKPELYREGWIQMSERRYVRELYALRSRHLPIFIADRCSAAVPTLTLWPKLEPDAEVRPQPQGA